MIMSSNDLHNTLKDLDITPAAMPLHQQALKNALVNHQVPKQTLTTKFRAALKNITGVPMAHKKTFLGAGTLASVAVLSLAIYSYGFSPRAQAQQLVSQSIGMVRTIGSDQISKLQSQLGSDPEQALKEAQAAKDLTVLTPDEFKTESAKHKGMAMSSLGKDGPQYGSVGISANGGLPPTPPEGASTHYSTAGPGGGSTQSGTVSINNSSASGAVTSGPATGDKGLQFHAGSESGPSTNQEGPVSFTPVTPSQYLRYTDSTGHVVVLGLDGKGLPVNKTIFMTDAEVQKM
jgi:hypothetical protein